MKAKRRHQLQENDLARELVKIGQFLKEHGNKLATGALVVAVLIFAYVLFFGGTDTEMLAIQRSWGDIMTGRSDQARRVEMLQNLTEQTRDRRIAALAGAQLGYEYATRALVAGTSSERQANQTAAAQEYQRVLSEFGSYPEAVAKAHYGMAKLHETQGRLNEAAVEYKKVVDQSELTGYPVRLLAEMNLRGLARLREPVNLVSTPPPAMTRPAGPTTGPTSMPTPATTPATAPVAATTQNAQG